jgi:hypothetical protein
MDRMMGMRQMRRLKVIAEERKKPWSWSNLLKAAKKRRPCFSIFFFHTEESEEIRFLEFINDSSPLRDVSKKFGKTQGG